MYGNNVINSFLFFYFYFLWLAPATLLRSISSNTYNNITGYMLFFIGTIGILYKIKNGVRKSLLFTVAAITTVMLLAAFSSLSKDTIGTIIELSYGVVYCVIPIFLGGLISKDIKEDKVRFNQGIFYGVILIFVYLISLINTNITMHIIRVGLLSNPQIFTNHLSFDFILIFLFLSQTKTAKYLILAIGLMVVIFSGNRGASIVYIVATIVVIMSKSNININTSIRKEILALLIVLISIFFITYGNDGIAITQFNKIHKASLGRWDMSSMERILNNREIGYIDAIKTISDNPLIGNFTYKYISGSFAHNTVIDIYAKMGLPGFLMTIILLIAMVRRAWRMARYDYEDKLMLLVFASFCSLTMVALTFQSYLYEPTWWFLSGIVLFYDMKKRKDN